MLRPKLLVAGCLLAVVMGGCLAEPTVPSPAPVSSPRVAPSLGVATVPPTPSPTPTRPPLGSGPVVSRYDDGLPSRLGQDPVLRGKAAIDFAAAQTDDTPFLVGGWVSYEGGVKYCALGPQPENYSWRTDCYFALLADAAGSSSPALNDAITFHYALDQMYTGPTVVVVRVHDPRAADCGSAVRSICDGMMVVQRVVWNGDSATAPGPLTPAKVRDALARVDGVGQMGATCTRPPWFGCGLDSLASADMYPFTVPDEFSLALLDVNVEPTAAALNRAIHVDAGVDGALKKAAVVSHVGSRYGYGKPWIWTDIRWLVVDNVAVLVSVHSPATAKDRQFMERIAAALEAEVAPGPG